MSVEISYKKKAPCSDCPFKKGARFHHGIVKDLPMMIGRICRGDFLFSCHQTDPRSDGYKKSRKTTQHCVGSLIFCEKIKERQLPAMHAIKKGELSMNKLKGFESVFDSSIQMLTHYTEHEEFKALKERGE